MGCIEFVSVKIFVKMFGLCCVVVYLCYVNQYIKAMRTIEKNIYKFSELSDEAKENAIDRIRDINFDFDWWNSIYEDAEQAGIKINGFDLGRGSYCNGYFIDSAIDAAELIKANHGDKCDTYNTATEFLKDRDTLVFKYSDGIKTDVVSEDNEYDFDNECDDLENEFLKSILEDYRIILQHEYEYKTSEEAIIETIDANEYEFYEDGEVY